MKKIFLGLFVLIAVLSLSVVLVKAENETSVALTDGVQIRTDGNNGLRWEATVTNSAEGQVYGFLFAQGELTAEQLNKDTAGVIAKEVEGLKEDGKYHATMVRFPKDAAVQDITVRAYVRAGEEYIYSENVVTRNLAEIAIATKNSNPDGVFVSSVYNYISENYMNVQIDSKNNIRIGNSIFESNPEKLEEEFIKDWNEKFGTSLTEVSIASMYDLGKTGFSSSSDLDPSVGNYFKFFRDSENGYEQKWSWLLEFFAKVDNTVHVANQANAILNYDIENSINNNTSKLYYNDHLTCALSNFFNGEANKKNYTGLDFTVASRYSSLLNYNDVIYCINPNFVKIGENYSFNALTPAIGYEFAGYKNENLYEDSYQITSTSEILKPVFSVVNYTVKFFDGENELDTIQTQYNIESGLTLPDYYSEGKSFAGWFDNPEFEGEEIKFIPVGSTGNKVYYAKLVVGSVSEITFDYMDAKAINDIYNEFRADVAYYSVNDSYDDKFLENSESHGYSYDYLPLSSALTKSPDVFAPKWQWLFNIIADTNNTSSYKNAIKNMGTGTFTADSIYIFCQELKGLKGNYQAPKYYSVTMYDWSTDTKDSKTSILNATKTSNKVINLVIGELIEEKPSRDGFVFAGWYTSKDYTGSQVTNVPGENQTLYAKWLSNVSVTFDANGGALPSEYAYASATKTYNIHEYNNSSATKGNNVFCDTSVTSYSSLRWCYKVLLKYNAALNLYEVVCVDGATASANNAATAAGVTWTHAIYNENINISKELSVGQYLLFENDPVKGMNACAVAVFDSIPEQCTITLNYNKPLLVPVREGYTFLGWKSSVDGSIVTEFPGYSTNPGAITYTAQWQAN